MVFLVMAGAGLFALTQLASFLWLGLIDGERAVQSLLALIPVAIFLPLAVWLSRFFSDRAFNMVVMGLLMIIEARLIWRLVA